MSMNVTVVGVVLLVVVAVIVVSLAGFRVMRLRSRGTAVLLRNLPAHDDRGWRHGIVRYDDHSLIYYRLSSLRTGPSEIFPRQAIETRGRREPRGTEVEVIDAMTILEIDADGSVFEMAMASGAVTAFQSWVESRPPIRSERRRSA